jgi:hypothetical protein
MDQRIFLIVLLNFMVMSCDKRLDIEPQQAISTSLALSTEQGIRTALIGTYDLLSQGETFAGDAILNADLLADTESLFWNGFTIEIRQILDKRIAVNNAPVKDYWIQAYRTINQANTVLDALEVVNQASTDTIKVVKTADSLSIVGELRFIRGLVYFDLINLFAKSWTDGNPDTNLGVPLISTPAAQNIKQSQVPRSTVTEVYQFLIEDLQFAKANLPIEHGAFANTYGASALLSRIYLMQEKFDLALAEADRVIKAGTFALLPELGQVYNRSENGTEDIFAIQITSQDGFNRVSFFYSGETDGGIGLIAITDEHLAIYEAGDLRSDLFYIDPQDSVRRTAKWRLNNSNGGNVTTIRLAEMYLTRAESRFRMGDSEGAAEDINLIRNRAGLSAYAASEITLEIILKERFIELIFEGHQLRDIKRTRKSFGGIPFDDPQLIYPLPQREMDVNGALIQNEGY